MKRRGEKRIGAGREKSPSFTKITREMKKKQWRANNNIIVIVFIFGKSMEKFTYIWKIKLSQP